MNDAAEATYRPLRVSRYAIALTLGWTVVIATSLGSNLLRLKQDFVEQAHMEASGAFAKDVIFQRWISGHGGVYVPVTEHTPPNPNLSHLEERDIVTPSGRRLTLVNAAYAIRQLYGPGGVQLGVRGHFTSLNPLRPENSADSWEVRALESFERGEREVSEIAMLDGKPNLRLMRPIFTTESCLKCHSEQGYEVGDIRGGFSLSVPMEPYWPQASARMLPLLPGHGAIWLLGLAGLGIATRSIRRGISQRERAEEALRESEERFRAIFDQAAVGVAQVETRTGRFVRFNQKYRDIVGLDAADMTATTFMAITHPDDLQADLDNMERLTKGTIRNFSMEKRYIRPDGKIVWVNLTVSPMWEVGEQPDYHIAVVEDITQRKRGEEERQELSVRLQTVAKQESLAVLAGGVAHDFNNLLVAILGNADLALAELPPSSPARGGIADITKASRRAADLCKQMLAYSGRGHFTVEPLDLSALVEEMSHLLEVTISKKTDLRCDLAADLPTVEADTTQIRQILMNLITNAAEAIGDRSGVISISTGAMHCDRAYLSETYLGDDLLRGMYSYVEVSDTGCGMDHATQARIFDPFFTTKFTGRGLGLASVLGIIRGHNGALKVRSEAGSGTTFRVLFPAADVPAAQPSDEAARAGTLRGSGTILLVDDEKAVRRVGRRMLELSGFDVMTAANGREALRVFTEHQREIDCVVLDLTMPEMDGEETLRELTQIQSDVRVVLSSGYDENEISNRFAGKGLTGFVQKPYDAATLVAEVAQALGI